MAASDRRSLARATREARSRRASEQLLEQGAHELWIDRAATLFHGLPHEEAEQALLARAHGGGLARKLLDQAEAQLFESSAVGHDLHAALFDDRARARV